MVVFLAFCEEKVVGLKNKSSYEDFALVARRLVVICTVVDINHREVPTFQDLG